MAEYSRMAKGNFTSNGASQAVYLPFVPDFVEFINYTASASGSDNGVPMAYWDADMGQNVAVVNRFQAANQLTTDTVDSAGISTFSAGLLFQFGASQQVVASTKADPASFEVTGHGYQTGDIVMFQGLYSTQYTAGMPQMDGIPFMVTRTDADNFTVPWNSNQSNYTALAASPTGARVKKVLYPFLYAPGVSFIEGLTLAATTTVDCSAPHNLVVGQQVVFRIPPEWGTDELNEVGNGSFPGQLQSGYVVSVTDSTTVVVNINSAAFTAFDSNQAVSAVPGLSFPVMLAVGDVNSGGVQVSAGSALYPPPVVNGVNTINGPAIQGAYVNNTRNGFLIGPGTAQGDSSAVLIGANNDVIYWRAYLHDLSL